MRLRRLLDLRSPRCEWPGCGVRAVRCDAEHDIAWPDGPTCACNLGPCCRRHHRVKQTGWTKTRHDDGTVTWTSPTGRSWRSSSTHEAAATAVRSLPTVAVRPEHADEHDRWIAAGRPDPGETAPDDREPADDYDRTATRLEHPEWHWTGALTDPYPWQDPRSLDTTRLALHPPSGGCR